VRSRQRVMLLVMLLVPGLLAAQGPPASTDEGRPKPGPGGPPKDALFYRGMAMLALDEKATMLAEAGSTDEAIAELRKVYDYDIPNDHPAFEIKVRLIGELATLYAADGRKAEAVNTIKGMLADLAEGTPAEAAAWFEAGKTYRAAGMVDEALEAFDRAIALSDALAKRSLEEGPRCPGGPPHRDSADRSRRPPPPPPHGDEPR